MGELAVDPAKRMRALEERIGICERVFALQYEKAAVRTDLINTLIRDLEEHAAAKKRLTALNTILTKCEGVISKLREHAALESKKDKIAMLLVDIEAHKSSQQAVKEKERLINERICPVCGNKLNF